MRDKGGERPIGQESYSRDEAFGKTPRELD